MTHIKYGFFKVRVKLHVGALCASLSLRINNNMLLILRLK
jgi:hypothetical protein